MTYATFDQTRDPRIEDPTNRWFADPLARIVMPAAIRLGLSANAISVIGLGLGGASAFFYARWAAPGWVSLGLLLSIAWLVADSLDGMVARATGTASAFGRELDGLCDHGVFAMIYVAIAWSVGTPGAWRLMIAAMLLHAIQSNLYEAEKARFHRRVRGEAPTPPATTRNPATRIYNAVAASLDGASAPFEAMLRDSAHPRVLGQAYGRAAAPAFRAMLPLSQNLRVAAIFLACHYRAPEFYLWLEIAPLTALTIAGIVWHRRVEAELVEAHAPRR